MTRLDVPAGEQRLESYLNRLGKVLGRDERRASFATYALGILGDGERKSVEPIAARACADPARADAVHQRLLHFMVDSRWSDRDVRREAARYALEAMAATCTLTPPRRSSASSRPVAFIASTRTSTSKRFCGSSLTGREIDISSSRRSTGT